MSRKKKELTPEEAGQAAAVQAASAATAAEAGTTQTAPEFSKELDHLNSELESTRAKMDEYLQGWQRALADFSNYKRRIERDQATANQAAAGNIIKRYLDVVDDLDRALKNRPQDGEGARWADGIELIYRKLLMILDAEGVKLIDAEGKGFDPAMHEAISMESSSEIPSGYIIGVIQQGYTLGDKVLRPARVRVAR
ncbi:MAG: nucleotide exchange factor GrpE [Anaerolineales bacterium]|jgi:molecular chaperone GrpE|nr:nucleotide exchange factor GrpE [Anaerolineales bacterium]